MSACTDPGRTPDSVDRQRSLAHQRAAEIDHEWVATSVEFAIGDDETLTHLCDAVASSAAAVDHHPTEAEGGDLDQHHRSLVRKARDRSFEAVAEECVEIITALDRDDDQREAADEWLQSHPEVVERADLASVVDGLEGHEDR